MSIEKENVIFKVGIIGCGGIANCKYMPSLSKITNVEMIEFCDIIRSRADIDAINTATSKAIQGK